MADAVKNGLKMENRANNGRFVKGHKGGPGRPPKEFCIADNLREILAEECLETKRTRLQNILRKTVQDAEDGDKDARNFIAERTEGKVKDTLAIEKIDVPPILLRLPTPEELQAIRGKDHPSSAV